MGKKVFFTFLISFILLYGCGSPELSTKENSETKDKAKVEMKVEKRSKDDSNSNGKSKDYSEVSMQKFSYEDLVYGNFAQKTLTEWFNTSDNESRGEIVTASGEKPKQELIGINFDEMTNSFYLLTKSFYVKDFLFNLRVIDDGSEDSYLDEEKIRSWIEGEYLYTLYSAYAETEGGSPSRLDISSDDMESWEEIFRVNEKPINDEAVKKDVPKFEFHKLYQVELLQSPIEIVSDDVKAKISSLEYLYDTTNGSGYYSVDLKIDSKEDKQVQFDIRNYGASDSSVINENIDLYKGVTFDKKLNSEDNDYLYLEDKIVLGIDGDSIIINLKNDGFNIGNNFFVEGHQHDLLGIKELTYNFVTEKKEFQTDAFDIEFYGYTEEQEAPPIAKEKLNKNRGTVEVNKNFSSFNFIGTDNSFEELSDLTRLTLNDNQITTELKSLAKVN